MIAPTLAWQFAPKQSIGIAPIIAFQRFKAEGLQAFDNPAFSTSPGNVTNNGYSDSWGVGVRVGYMGVGPMGHGAAKNILEKGYPLIRPWNMVLFINWLSQKN